MSTQSDNELARELMIEFGLGIHNPKASPDTRYQDIDMGGNLNEGNVKRHSLERLDSMVEAVSGKRLTYARLTA